MQKSVDKPKKVVYNILYRFYEVCPQLLSFSEASQNLYFKDFKATTSNVLY